MDYYQTTTGTGGGGGLVSILAIIATLLGVSQLGPIFGRIPTPIRQLYSYRILRYLLLTLLVWHFSRLSPLIAVIASVIFIAAIEGWNYYETMPKDDTTTEAGENTNTDGQDSGSLFYSNPETGLPQMTSPQATGSLSGQQEFNILTQLGTSGIGNPAVVQDNPYVRR